MKTLQIMVFLFCTMSHSAYGQSLQYLGLLPINANKDIGLLWSEVSEFAPVNAESFDISFAVNDDAHVSLEVYSADGDLIRRLVEKERFEVGPHTVTWDGRDDEGILVPDEAYIPVFTAETSAGSIVDDPRRYSGGEIITNIDWTLRGKSEISYTIPYAARVLIRSGVKDGPMMRELMHWEPVSPGKAVIRWDGYDADGVDNYAIRDDVWYVIMAYRLPEFAIITSGNLSQKYSEYRQKKNWPTPVPDMASVELQRDGIRLEQDYFMPRAYLPRVILDFAEETDQSEFGMAVVKGRVKFKVDVPATDRWILDSSFYETGFYINYKFQSEEEQGFVPLIWDYDASMLEPGRHVATVQLFGFGGFISSDTVEFIVTP